ncbi:hypothetical protein [Prauserella muralis]|uniref:hypothetical protein n=1 Tax=Prauserella muralis TaxID=588067 RepID=UPI0011AD13C8|nr:hypothetical protein [Prauserella muralis]TWE27494.1 hypothetical protein FHX69_0127 [Prauserella muralis]
MGTAAVLRSLRRGRHDDPATHGPTFGPFGLDKYDSLVNGYFLTTLLAHAAMGIALAAVIHTRARNRGLLLTKLR